MSEDEDYNYLFTAQIVQYVKGKPSNKSSVKAGVLQSGKIKLTTLNGIKELERSGKWVLLKLYSTDGKLLQDTKMLADIPDEYASTENPATVSEDDLYVD